MLIVFAFVNDDRFYIALFSTLEHAHCALIVNMTLNE